MSIFTAIRSIFGSTGAPRVDIGVQYNNPANYTERAADVSFDSAMQMSAVWACIRIISETISSLPFEIYRIDGDGREVATNLAGAPPSDDEAQCSFKRLLSFGSRFYSILFLPVTLM